MEKIYLIFVFSAIIILIILLGLLQTEKEIKPHRRRSIIMTRTKNNCGCFRQSNNGTRGFCAQCINGTLFGCPGGCYEDCHKYKYSVNAAPECTK